MWCRSKENERTNECENGTKRAEEGGSARPGVNLLENIVMSLPLLSFSFSECYQRSGMEMFHCIRQLSGSTSTCCSVVTVMTPDVPTRCASLPLSAPWQQQLLSCDLS